MKMHRILFGLFVVSLLSISAMALPPNCTGGACSSRVNIKSARQGAFSFQADSFSSAIASPRNASTGMSSGRRQHQTVTITKLADAASPKLQRALKDNEVLPEVTVELVREERGESVVYHTITLHNAQIAGIHTGVEAGARKGGAEQETVEFAYEKMEMKATPGKTMAIDSWSVK